MERFDAEASLAAIEKLQGHRHADGPDHVRPDAQAARATYASRYDVSSHAARRPRRRAVPADVKHAMIDWWGPILSEYYASTEGNGITLITSAGVAARSAGSVGQARARDRPHLRRRRRRTARRRGRRRSTSSATSRPFEYHNDPEKTAGARHPGHDNWTTVGDLGYLDEDGYLFLTDRKAFMIISGGVNIYPQEVENVLDAAPRGLRRRGDRRSRRRDGRAGQGGRPAVATASAPSEDSAAEIIEYVRDGSRTSRRRARSTSSTSSRARRPESSSNANCRIATWR